MNFSTRSKSIVRANPEPAVLSAGHPGLRSSHGTRTPCPGVEGGVENPEGKALNAAGRPRRPTRQIRVGTVPVGGNALVTVQSMTSTNTSDVRQTVEQIRRLEEAGCEIVRVAVPDDEAASALGPILREIRIPLVADIHFHYKLALKSIEQGVHCIRINPGNIGGIERLREVVRAAEQAHVPIRVGVNSGSLEDDILRRHGFKVTASALVESAVRNVRILEDAGFGDVKISVKSTDVLTTIEAYRLLSAAVDYPLHLGVTEAGRGRPAHIKSAIAMGALLMDGIGDTIRISLTEDPVNEVHAAYDLLKAIKLRERGVDLITCPTCGRIEIDLMKLSDELERRLGHIREPVRVAVLGCVVNGPGEAREADIGIAGGRGVGMLVKDGKFVRKVKESDMVDVLVEEVEKIAAEKRRSR
ncbi:MAG: flavodoxin-dependent (E)-4-hydroxy-3-methylbut-2-enyl-diphosphate synthase [Nitrospirae bacterium]|nr:flavodoxin-dependent (E)-4-hydroxy-3-methylbut-2-enyl-diphosphate synthase [Nitrospirota bacterium]